MTAPWTCPFCPLLCDDQTAATTDCAVARAALVEAIQTPPPPHVNGVPVSLDTAVQAAAAGLRQSRQPLMGGWGVDVAGARALVHLARRTEAITDAASGDALTETLRVQQDHGGFATTLAEVRQHADLVVFVGSWAPTRAPRLLARVLDGRIEMPTLVYLGDPALAPTSVSAAGAVMPVHHLPIGAPEQHSVGTSKGQRSPRDLFTALAGLQARLAGSWVDPAPTLNDESNALSEPNRSDASSDQTTHTSEAIQDLANLVSRLSAARYAVLVWEPAQLGPHAALLIERLQRIIGHLNQRSRAAGLALGGAQGGGTAQQVHTWLTGLPMRSRLSADPEHPGEHDPLRFDASRPAAEGHADLLLWVGSFPGMRAPQTANERTRTRIVLGGAASLDPADKVMADAWPLTIFIPVAVPGVHQGGHLIRADGVVTLPLHALPVRPTPAAYAALVNRTNAAPSAADILTRLLKELDRSTA